MYAASQTLTQHWPNQNIVSASCVGYNFEQTKPLVIVEHHYSVFVTVRCPLPPGQSHPTPGVIHTLTPGPVWPAPLLSGTPPAGGCGWHPDMPGWHVPGSRGQRATLKCGSTPLRVGVALDDLAEMTPGYLPADRDTDRGPTPNTLYQHWTNICCPSDFRLTRWDSYIQYTINQCWLNVGPTSATLAQH